MNDTEALQLKKGDRVLYNCRMWKVQNVKYVRHNGYPHVEIKIRRGNNIMYAVWPSDIEVVK